MQTYQYYHVLGNAWVSNLDHLPLARILIGRCWANHVPNLRHLQRPFQTSLILLLGITGASAVISPVPWVTPLAKILTGRCWVNHVPTLGTSSGLSSSYKNISLSLCTGLVFTSTLIQLMLLLPWLSDLSSLV